MLFLQLNGRHKTCLNRKQIKNGKIKLWKRGYGGLPLSTPPSQALLTSRKTDKNNLENPFRLLLCIKREDMQTF